MSCSVSYSPVGVGYSGLLGTFWIELLRSWAANGLALPEVNVPSYAHLPFGSLAHSSLLASPSPDRYFVSAGKADSLQLQCLWNFTLHLAPCKATVEQQSRDLHQFLLAFVRTSGKAERSSTCSSDAHLPTPE